MTARDTRQLALGTYVYCTVSAVQGWYRVTDIRPRDGYIKISGERVWCPPHNFSLVDRQGKSYLSALEGDYDPAVEGERAAKLDNAIARAERLGDTELAERLKTRRQESGR